MNKFKKVFLSGVLPLGILVLSVVGAQLLIASRAEPSRQPRVEPGAAVEVREVTREAVRPTVSATGTVIASRQLDVVPQVAGRITWLYESLDPGTFIDAGQPLFRVEAVDYALRVSQAKAQLEQARAQMALEEGQQEVARQEWEMFKAELGGAEEDPSLALREPQLRAAQVSVEVAEANLKTARLNLSRTSFRAPFSAVVVDASAEIGQLVGAQSRIARLVGTDEFWVRVALPVDALRRISVPGVQGAAEGEEGSRVVVRQDIGGGVIEREGRVVRLLSNLDPAGRMARLLVSIEDPYGLKRADEAGRRPYPILLDAYVDVEIEARRDAELIEVPRAAVRQGDQAYVYDVDERVLEVRDLEIAWRRAEAVFVASGLEPGELVITSPLASPVEGMKLRRADEVVAPEGASGAADETEASDE